MAGDLGTPVRIRIPPREGIARCHRGCPRAPQAMRSKQLNGLGDEHRLQEVFQSHPPAPRPRNGSRAQARRRVPTVLGAMCWLLRRAFKVDGALGS